MRPGHDGERKGRKEVLCVSSYTESRFTITYTGNRNDRVLKTSPAPKEEQC